MRNRITKRVSKAFTLVEILIVVVILGILAAIVVPQFANATKDSQAGNIKAQIKSVSNQLELYKARVGTYPSETELNTDSTIAPTAGTPGGWGVMLEGGYLRTPPKNPTNQSSVVEGGTLTVATGEIDGTASATNGLGAGWVYDELTGDFGANNFSEATGTLRFGG